MRIGFPLTVSGLTGGQKVHRSTGSPKEEASKEERRRLCIIKAGLNMGLKKDIQKRPILSPILIV